MAKTFIEKLGDVLASWDLFGSKAPSKRLATRELRLYLPIEGDKLWVGSLSQEQGDYVFRYSTDFRKRLDIPPVAAFPDKDREYRAEKLWPFFQARLPSTNRPEVERMLKEREIDPEDTFLILAELGKKTITTPYEFELHQLQPSHA